MLARLSSLVLRCLTLPSDELERHKFIKYYSLSSVRDLYAQMHGGSGDAEALDAALVEKADGKVALFSLVAEARPNPTRLISAVELVLLGHSTHFSGLNDAMCASSSHFPAASRSTPAVF